MVNDENGKADCLLNNELWLNTISKGLFVWFGYGQFDLTNKTEKNKCIKQKTKTKFFHYIFFLFSEENPKTIKS